MSATERASAPISSRRVGKRGMLTWRDRPSRTRAVARASLRSGSTMVRARNSDSQIELSSARVRTSVRPDYPDAAKRTRTQGTVVLEVEVYRDGSVGNIRVQRSIIGLDDAAIAAVRRVRFQPGKSGGHPIDTLVIIPVEFRLN